MNKTQQQLDMPSATINIAGNQGEYATIDPPMLSTASPSRTFQSKHYKAMSMVQPAENMHLNDFVSPYSVLRGSTD